MSDKPENIWNQKLLTGFSLFGFFRWSVLKRVLFVFVCLLTLIVLALAEENWRGKRAWENYRREWEAKGEKLDAASFVPPPLPDEQNFAMTPFLAPLYDFNPRPLQPGQDLWRDTNALKRTQSFADELFTMKSNAWHDRLVNDFDFWTKTLKSNTLPADSQFKSRAEAATEMLKSIEPYRPVLDELSKAARERPRCRFNISYGDANPAGILLPHLSVCKRIGSIYALRATGELAAGRGDDALADTKMVLFMSDTMKDEPFLISGLVRVSLLNIAVQPMRDGLQRNQWSDAQLAQLQERLQQYDLVAECAHDLRGERAHGNGLMDFLRGNRREGQEMLADNVNSPLGILRFVPGGWLYQNQLNLNRMHEKYTLPGVDAANHRFYPGRSATDAWVAELDRGFRPYMMITRLIFPAVGRAQQKFAFAQTAVDEAAVACALERYRLANAHYPDSLDVLAPQFMKSIPRDVISGEPLKYRRADGGYLIYSVGWNEKDDGGTVAMTSSKSPVADITQGDWVWQQGAVVSTTNKIFE